MRSATPLLILLASLFLGACKQETAVERANREGVLLFGNGSEVRTIDPQLSTELNASRIQDALFDGLVIPDPVTMKPAALGAAKSWEISEDGLTYTFHLRPDAKWSNGDPVTAEHFVYSYQRILSKALASRYSYMLYPMKNAEEFHKEKISDFSQVGVKALDKFTLQIELNDPTPYLLDLMTHHAWYPVYPPAVEEHGGMTAQVNHWTRAENIIGNGAFKMKEWKLNTYLDVERRDDYWDKENVNSTVCASSPSTTLSLNSGPTGVGQSTLPTSSLLIVLAG